jgi:hypothetical protein
MEATAWLGLARFALMAVPFRWIAPHLGQGILESPTIDDPDQGIRLQRISRAVVTTSRYTPWESKCLVQAIAAKMMLKCRGIHSTLYLGVAKEGEKELSAHAWLRSGTLVLTGAPGKERFTVVATFAEGKE